MADGPETPSGTAGMDNTSKSSNWTIVLYVCVSVIPIAFICCGIWWYIRKTRRDPKAKQLDLEMNKIGKNWWSANYLELGSQDNLSRQAQKRERVYENLLKTQRPNIFKEDTPSDPGLKPAPQPRPQPAASLPTAPPPVAVSTSKRDNALGPDPRQFYEGYGPRDDMSSVYSQEEDIPNARSIATTFRPPAPVRPNASSSASTSEIERILRLDLGARPSAPVARTPAAAPSTLDSIVEEKPPERTSREKEKKREEEKIREEEKRREKRRQEEKSRENEKERASRSERERSSREKGKEKEKSSRGETRETEDPKSSSSRRRRELVETHTHEATDHLSRRHHHRVHVSHSKHGSSSSHHRSSDGHKSNDRRHDGDDEREKEREKERRREKEKERERQRDRERDTDKGRERRRRREEDRGRRSKR
ncbi:hypothetical protein QBC47DRAFT_456178 [Echria macrotheca]|uniref:Uncharacterized protein n=1 Tax=Echria macrotheca TaxID=438768 RepID=A0AAJ0BNT3_9PEZI|nr:hypothetical protein QBC47DRAFT_456178 [Echria macrotheca]